MKRFAYRQTPMHQTRDGVELISLAKTRTVGPMNAVAKWRGEMERNQCRTGVVLEFAARRGAHGSDSGKFPTSRLSTAHHLFDGDKPVRKVADRPHLCERNLLAPLTDSTLRNTEVSCDGGRSAGALIEPSREVHGPSLAKRKPVRQGQSKLSRFSIDSTMENARRRRFIAYFDTVLKGSRERLMQKTGLTKGRVSQLFDDKQAFGEVAARNLAERLKLPPHYFENDQGAERGDLSPEALDMARRFDALTPAEQIRFARLLSAAQDDGGSQWAGDLGSLRAGFRK